MTDREKVGLRLGSMSVDLRRRSNARSMRFRNNSAIPIQKYPFDIIGQRGLRRITSVTADSVSQARPRMIFMSPDFSDATSSSAVTRSTDICLFSATK